MVKGPIAQGMRAKLEAAFAPSLLEILDESASHKGHQGARAEGESHFFVRLRSTIFQGKSRLEAQRMVYAVLKDELQGPIHALRLEIGPA